MSPVSTLTPRCPWCHRTLEGNKRRPLELVKAFHDHLPCPKRPPPETDEPLPDVAYHRLRRYLRTGEMLIPGERYNVARNISLISAVSATAGDMGPLGRSG